MISEWIERPMCGNVMICSELRDDTLYIVMEKGDTDLNSYLKRSKAEDMTDSQVSFLWAEMCRCVHTLHTASASFCVSIHEVHA